jgi:hypothetical protein
MSSKYQQVVVTQRETLWGVWATMGVKPARDLLLNIRQF